MLRLKALPLGLALLFCAFSLFAAETEMIMPQPPFVAGEPLTISFLFYGMSPDAVFFEGEVDTAANYAAYIEETFPPSFLVESARKSSVALPQRGVFAASGSRAAAVSIEAIPKEAGEFTLGPFSFRAGGELVTFPPVRVLVESSTFSAGQQGGALRLFWLVQERQGAGFVSPAEALSLDAGRGALIVLMAPSEAEGSLSCPAPENALLEAAAVNPLELAALLPLGLPSGYSPAAAYIWTPLFSGRQNLPKAAFAPAAGGAVSFSEDAEAYVAEPQIAQNEPPERETVAAATLPATRPAPPHEKPQAFSPRAADSRFEANLANTASSLWDEGQPARAAVILRSAENAFPFRQRIAEMRAAADEALGTKGKSAGALELCLLFAPFMLILLDLILFVAFFISWAVPSKKGGKVKASFGGKKLIIACAVFAALAAGGALYTSLSGGIEEAAASGGFIRRVPDAEAAAVAAVKPGTPLKVLSRLQSWSYVKTLSGETGWYPSSEIIVYKTGELHEFRQYP